MKVVPFLHESDCVQLAIKTIAYMGGRIKRTLAGCQKIRFGPGRGKNIFLTSPFIERITLIYNCQQRISCKIGVN